MPRPEYEAVVYFAGPLSLWQGYPHAEEVLARRRSRWLWLAHAKGKAVLQQIDDEGRCGLLVTRDGQVFVDVPPAQRSCSPDRTEEVLSDLFGKGAV